jgi:hypothetical protein
MLPKLCHSNRWCPILGAVGVVLIGSHKPSGAAAFTPQLSRTPSARIDLIQSLYTPFLADDFHKAKLRVHQE